MFGPNEYETRGDLYTAVVLEVVGEKSVGYIRAKDGYIEGRDWDFKTGRRHKIGNSPLDLMPPEPEIEFPQSMLDEMFSSLSWHYDRHASCREAALIAIRWYIGNKEKTDV